MKTYIAILTQQGTNPPIADVKLNELDGEVEWGYLGTGDYEGRLAGGFPEGTIIRSHTLWDIENGQLVYQYRTSDDTVEVRTWDVSSFPSVNQADGILGNVVGQTTYIEIVTF